MKNVIERCLTLGTNPRDKVLTPFMGVGSEVYGAVEYGRLGIGFELKLSYFRQACANIKMASVEKRTVGELQFEEENPVEDLIE